MVFELGAFCFNAHFLLFAFMSMTKYCQFFFNNLRVKTRKNPVYTDCHHGTSVTLELRFPFDFFSNGNEEDVGRAHSIECSNEGNSNTRTDLVGLI